MTNRAYSPGEKAAANEISGLMTSELRNRVLSMGCTSLSIIVRVLKRTLSEIVLCGKTV
jgi:hypothetical protein